MELISKNINKIYSTFKNVLKILKFESISHDFSLFYTGIIYFLKYLISKPVFTCH